MDHTPRAQYPRVALDQGSNQNSVFGDGSTRPGFYECRPEGSRRSRYAAERDEERVAEEKRRIAEEEAQLPQANTLSGSAFFFAYRFQIPITPDFPIPSIEKDDDQQMITEPKVTTQVEPLSSDEENGRSVSRSEPLLGKSESGQKGRGAGLISSAGILRDGSTTKHRRQSSEDPNEHESKKQKLI